MDIIKINDAESQQYNDIALTSLMEERKQWYLCNEYAEFNGNLPPFIQLKLDTDLRRDMSVLMWLDSLNKL